MTWLKNLNGTTFFLLQCANSGNTLAIMAFVPTVLRLATLKQGFGGTKTNVESNHIFYKILLNDNRKLLLNIEMHMD
jgi:hypothetical protein